MLYKVREYQLPVQHKKMKQSFHTTQKKHIIGYFEETFCKVPGLSHFLMVLILLVQRVRVLLDDIVLLVHEQYVHGS